MPTLIIELEKCIDNKEKLRCPYCTDKLTKGYGYAIDYMCSAMNNRITSGYVEWEKEINPVPTWCPKRADKEEMLAQEVAKFVGEGI